MHELKGFVNLDKWTSFGLQIGILLRGVLTVSACLIGCRNI